jgi:preprotein translocase subunit SecA
MIRHHETVSVRTRFTRMLDRVRDRSVEWNLAHYYRRLAALDARAKELTLKGSDDSTLRGLATRVRHNARDGVPLDDIVNDGFALARKAITRTLGLRPFDVQMIAALALQRGRVVELPTGEAKTLVAVPPTRDLLAIDTL